MHVQPAIKKHRNDVGEVCVIDTLHPGEVFGVTALAAELEHVDACGKPCGEPGFEITQRAG